MIPGLLLLFYFWEARFSIVWNSQIGITVLGLHVNGFSHLSILCSTYFSFAISRIYFFILSYELLCSVMQAMAETLDL